MNNDVLRLHERDATNFETGEILNDAVNVTEQRKINDLACLEFDYPMNDKARLICENMLVSNQGRIYEILRITRKMDSGDIIHVVAADMFSRRAKHTFLPNIPDLIGKKVSEVIGKALETATDFSLFTDEELSALGMNWVGNDEFLIDFFSTDKITLWAFLQTVIANLGRGELYSNGRKFSIVDRIGQDRGVRLSLDKNMQNIEIERDTEDIITKLTPFGADDLTVKSVNNGKEYILSPNADIYGVHEGYKDYSDYTDPNKILANAKWEFDSENEERIDIPKITITGNLIDLSKLEEYGDIEKVELGDTVHVYDVDGVEHVQRVIEGIWHPYEAETTRISIGHMRRDLFFTIYQLRHTKMELEKVQTTSKQITTRKMQGIVNTDRNEVQSDNELFKIIGDLQTVKDTQNRVRIRMGNYNGKFIFAIYDPDGDEAVKFDEDGEGFFAGVISTLKDCLIQGELRVGLSGNNTKGIAFYGDSYQPDADGNYSTPYARIVPYVANNEDFKGINVEGGKLCVNESPVVTEKDFNFLQQQIEHLTEKLNNLKKQVDTIS